MAVKNEEWKKGYDDAIEAIRKALAEQPTGGESGDSDLPIQNTPGESSEDSNSSQGDSQKDPSNNSRNGSSGNNQGVVRPEDCVGPQDLNNVPGNAGGMISKEAGAEITEKEGYDKDNASESGKEREWRDAALNAVKSIGDKAGSFVSKIEGLYKVTKDWKKELKNIVGRSLSPEDKRQAYANKNILISQDRIARTDKDKYDNMDYMMAWIDSSGSMSNDQLKQCLTEVYAVALAKKPIKLVVIQCDTRIQDIKEYTDLRQLKKDITHATVMGRGGTELKPCWDLLTNDKKYSRMPAELVMIFTDGMLTQYKRNPRTMKNLCWVIIDNPSFETKYKDINTKVVRINSQDIK